MSNRITQKDLEAVVARINDVTGSPKEAYNLETRTSNIGNYHLSYAYGGVALHRMHNERGGIQDIFHGHMPKRELYEKMQAFISGLTARKD
jgi:hypothetical protein